MKIYKIDNLTEKGGPQEVGMGSCGLVWLL